MCGHLANANGCKCALVQKNVLLHCMNETMESEGWGEEYGIIPRERQQGIDRERNMHACPITIITIML